MKTDPLIGYCPLASGSKGNAIYFGTKETKILIDAGLSRKATVERLAQIGVRLEDLDAILVTHDHTDHIQGLKLLSYKHQIPIFCNRETAQGIIHHFGKGAKFKIFTTGEPFYYQDMSVTPFTIQHDTVDPVAFTIQTDTHKFGFCADLGFVTSLVTAHLTHCDYLYVEANHEPQWVHSCPRPITYKKRVLSRMGHLSNQEAAHLLENVISDQTKHVHLAHLSSECNSKEKALEVVHNHLAKKGIQIAIDIAPQNTIGTPISTEKSCSPMLG